jgi:outer membrane protein assembly factor BamB
MRQRLLLLPLILTAVMAMAADWPQFRGPGGLGIAPDKGLPLAWSDDSNLVWKTELPGPGSSSPIVVGKRVFLTCYSGYGLPGKPPGNRADLKRHLLCLDRNSGKLLWQRDVDAIQPEQDYDGVLRLHGYATNTAVSDGSKVYVFLGKTGVFAFDLDGKQLWQAGVGNGKNDYGSAASPILYKDLLIVNANLESRALVGLDKNTGKEIWRAAGYWGSWSTPMLVQVPNKGRTEVVVSDSKKVLGFDPDTGRELWHVNYDPPPPYVCASLTAHEGVVYPFANTGLAIRTGGSGDIGGTHVLWRKAIELSLTSPVCFESYLYWLTGSVINCIKADDGKWGNRERLRPTVDLKSEVDRPGDCFASPVMADGKIYCVSRGKGVFVIEANPKLRQLAHNVFRADTSAFNATPVVNDSQLLLRSDRYFYCIGTKPKP